MRVRPNHMHAFVSWLCEVYSMYSVFLCRAEYIQYNYVGFQIQTLLHDYVKEYIIGVLHTHSFEIPSTQQHLVVN